MTTEQSADDAVLGDVFSTGRDRGGKDAPSAEPPKADVEPPKVEPQAAAEPEKAKSEAESGETDPKGYRDPQTGRFVPLKELQTEREKRQAAERSRDEEARLRKEDAERNERRWAEIERNQRQAQNPPQPPPDPNIDPAGYFAHKEQIFEQKLLNERLNRSEMFARMKHGDDVVDAAWAAVQKAGLVRQFLNSPDYYGDAVKWHKRDLTLQRVGDDPDAYEKSIEERVRAKVLEELRTGNRAGMPGQAPAAPAPQQFPGSLADATASGPSAGHPQNDEAMMGNVFASGRKRR